MRLSLEPAFFRATSGGLAKSMKALVGLLLACGAAVAARAAEPVVYEIDLREPRLHLIHVAMTVPEAGRGTEFQFSAWNALYQIRDFVRNVQGVRAECDSRPESLAREDLNTWRAEERPCSALVLRYDVFANEEGPFSCGLNEEHAFLNFALALFYLPRERGRAVRVRFLLPEGWRLATMLEARGDSYVAANYDALADSPAEAGNFQEFSYRQGEATYRVVVDAQAEDYSPDKLLASLEKITAEETGLMRDVPFSRYTFIFHFPRTGGGGGMEHKYGTAISVGARDVHEHWEAVESVAAHEFFHLWNVKRIRPAHLEPVDYVHGNDTRDLWFSEGVTSTYGMLALVRAGLLSRKEFYANLAGEVGQLGRRPARLSQSVETSGREAWLEKYQDYYRPDRSISYYNKGMILGILLDLAIRRASANRRSLDDVMRRFNQEFARQGRFFTEADLRALIGEAAPGFDVDAFFRDYVAGTEELDYAKYFGYAGLELKGETEPPGAPGSPVKLRLEETSNASPEQLRVREGMLTGATTSP